MTWKNKFTAIQGRAKQPALPCCVSRLPPRAPGPLVGVCTQAAPHPHVTGLPAIHVLSSNFGEFPQNRSRETYQIWSGSPGLLGRITFLAPLSTHLWSPRSQCSHSDPGLPDTTTQLPSPRGHSGPCLVSPWVSRHYGHGVPDFWWNLSRVLRSTNRANYSLPTPDSVRHQFILILATNCTSGLDPGKGCTVKLSNSPCVTQLH